MLLQKQRICSCFIYSYLGLLANIHCGLTSGWAWKACKQRLGNCLNLAETVGASAWQHPVPILSDTENRFQGRNHHLPWSLAWCTRMLVERRTVGARAAHVRHAEWCVAPCPHFCPCHMFNWLNWAGVPGSNGFRQAVRQHMLLFRGWGGPDLMKLAHVVHVAHSAGSDGCQKVFIDKLIFRV